MLLTKSYELEIDDSIFGIESRNNRDRSPFLVGLEDAA